MSETMIDDRIDEYGCVRNTRFAALYVRGRAAGSACAVSLSVGHATMFHISFVDLRRAVPPGFSYDDGSARGLQINIDRHGSYALSWGQAMYDVSSLENWGIRFGVTAADLWPFFNTVLTGDDYYQEPMPWLERLGMTAADVGRP